MREQSGNADIVMLGTFSAWRRGTIQARALPIAQELTRRGLKVVIITTPWDEPSEAGVRDVIGGVPLINTRAVTLRGAPLAVNEMVRLTRQLKPAVVHVFKPRGFGGFAGHLLEREFPIVVDCDDWEGDGGWNRVGAYSMPLRRGFDWQERTLIRRACVVTAASSLLEARARRLRADSGSDAVVRVPNGLAEAWFEALSAARNSSVSAADMLTIPTVAVYSRFEEISADWLAQFVSALGELRSEPLRVSVIGPTADVFCGWSFLVVDLLGYVARSNLPAILSNASLAVVPLDDSLVSRSKQSVKLLELMAAGCPVIASDVGDVSTTLGDAGVLVRGSDPRLFARLTAAMIEPHDRLATLSLRGVRRVRELFGISQIASEVLSAYLRSGVSFA